MCRIAITTRSTPSAVLAASDASEGAVLGLGRLLPVARTVIVTTTARDTSHPKVKAAPLRTPRLDGSTTRNAVSGNGSSVTARPIRARSRTNMAVPSASREFQPARPRIIPQG
jgi:hypothetical protein